MEINRRIQDKFLADKSSLWIEFPDGSKKETDYNEVELVLKDIRFIKHELTNYSYLYASQLSFGGHLNRNYWEFLKLKGEIGQHDRDELEEGVLLVIYLLYAEIFEAEGWCYLYRNKLFDTVNSFLVSYAPDNDKKKKLKNCIQFSRDNYENEKIGDQWHGVLDPDNKKLSDKLTENDNWVYKTFVEDYFVDIANSFKPGRQRTKNFCDSIMKKGKK
ncbi:hypothetical protein [Persicobacter psychrovividus]|uniref:DUF4375 domain-containing protein n=1 Tax=Persicobacter psychrovividus TaxID=387638 RepID=A0ABM7VKL5_9BACT|nr:hypothetical protein PEPS_36850 [Persicobacter psychrovividus]